MAHSVTKIFLQVQNWLEEQRLLPNELRAWCVIILVQSPGSSAVPGPTDGRGAFLGCSRLLPSCIPLPLHSNVPQPLERGHWVQTIAELEMWLGEI